MEWVDADSNSGFVVLLDFVALQKSLFSLPPKRVLTPCCEQHTVRAGMDKSSYSTAYVWWREGGIDKGCGGKSTECGVSRDLEGVGSDQASGGWTSQL